MPATVKIRVHAGRELPVLDKSSKSINAYVSVSCAGSESSTPVVKRSSNPVWKTDFRFEVDKDAKLLASPVEFQVWDVDYVADRSIGIVYLDISPLLTRASASLHTRKMLQGSSQRQQDQHLTNSQDKNNSRGGIYSVLDPSNQLFIDGWFPIYDTLQGTRGSLHVSVKVQFFGDLNPFKDSSASVQFFTSCSLAPEVYTMRRILGFVEELVVENDPEFEWADKFRATRLSNDSRQLLLHRLSFEIRRQIGNRVRSVGGNAVLGFQEHFDVEGDSGIVARGYGTACILVPTEKTLSLDNNTSLPTRLFHKRTDMWISRRRRNHPTVDRRLLGYNGTSVDGRSAMAAQFGFRGPGGDRSTRGSSHHHHHHHNASNVRVRRNSIRADERDELQQSREVQLLTLTEFPPSLRIRLGGLVSARSVRFLGKVSSKIADQDTRDAWWQELREEVKLHARTLGCWFVIGYSETATVTDDVIILSATGTAARLRNPARYAVHGPTEVDNAKEEEKTTVVVNGRSDGIVNTVGNVAESNKGPPKQQEKQGSRVSGLLLRGAQEQLPPVVTDTRFADDPDLQKLANQRKRYMSAALHGGDSLRRLAPCGPCHVPFEDASTPYTNMRLTPCQCCHSKWVPEILMATIEPPSFLPIKGEGRMLQARVCRIIRAKKSDIERNSEANARSISETLPFIQFDLHRQLVTKMKVHGFNAAFCIRIQLQFDVPIMIGILTATAMYCSALPPPSQLRIVRRNPRIGQRKKPAEQDLQNELREKANDERNSGIHDGTNEDEGEERHQLEVLSDYHMKKYASLPEPLITQYWWEARRVRGRRLRRKHERERERLRREERQRLRIEQEQKETERRVISSQKRKKRLRKIAKDKRKVTMKKNKQLLEKEETMLHYVRTKTEVSSEQQSPTIGSHKDSRIGPLTGSSTAGSGQRVLQGRHTSNEISSTASLSSLTSRNNHTTSSMTGMNNQNERSVMNESSSNPSNTMLGNENSKTVMSNMKIQSLRIAAAEDLSIEGGRREFKEADDTKSSPKSASSKVKAMMKNEDNQILLNSTTIPLPPINENDKNGVVTHYNNEKTKDNSPSTTSSKKILTSKSSTGSTKSKIDPKKGSAHISSSSSSSSSGSSSSSSEDEKPTNDPKEKEKHLNTERRRDERLHEEVDNGDGGRGQEGDTKKKDNKGRDIRGSSGNLSESRGHVSESRVNVSESRGHARDENDTVPEMSDAGSHNTKMTNSNRNPPSDDKNEKQLNQKNQVENLNQNHNVWEDSNFSEDNFPRSEEEANDADNDDDLYEEDEMLDLSELELASASDIAIDIRNKEGEEEEEEDETLEENDENTNIEDDVFGGRVAVSSSTRIVMTTPSKHNKKDAKGNNNNAIDMKKNGPTPRQQQEHSVMKDREERGEGNGSIILNKHGQPVSPRSYSKKVLRAERRARKRAVMAAFRRPRNEINDVNEDLLAGQLRLGSRGTTGGTSTFARRDVYVLEIDDETDEDIMSVLLDRDIPRGLSFFSTERVSCLVQ
eukprot:g3425.t1